VDWAWNTAAYYGTRDRKTIDRLKDATMDTDGTTTKPSRIPRRLVNSLRRGETIVERIKQLAAITDEPGKLTRLYLGPAHKRAIEQVKVWMRAAGMTVRVDAVGTVVGHYRGETAGAPALLLGSHIDTVRNAGHYDGTLGVLAALAAVESLHAAGKRLPFAIEVLAFGDEEGVRFAGTLTGSRTLAGRFDPKVLNEVDRDGITRRQALADFGCDVSKIAAEARDPKQVLGYIEVHIEQGPVLEIENRPVGVVTAISGASRGKVTVTGVGGHAGTVPMAQRRDAAVAAAEMMLAVERHAMTMPDLVATVGTFEIPNGVVNAVPGETKFTLDVRCPSDELRKRALVDLQKEFERIAAHRLVGVDLAWTYDAPSAVCDDRLIAALSGAVQRAGLDVRHLPSGAGHDGMAFKDKFPFAMLFVRCRAGVSHDPAEFAALDDIDVAADILSDCVEALALGR
jgi:allantoate deiminase